MKNIRHLTATIACLALAGLCVPATGWAADASLPPAPQIADVALGNDGALVGQMVDGQNAPQSGVRISMQDLQNREVAAVLTDRQGSFKILGAPGGVYQLVTPQNRQVFRLWSPRMAPPLAQQGVLLVVPGQTVRGQLGDGSMVGGPAVVGAVIGAGVATAIAVPVTYGATKQPASN